MQILERRVYVGPNLYAHFPVVRLLVDLEALEDHPSAKIDGFVDGLVKALPGLEKHGCSHGVHGGFIGHEVLTVDTVGDAENVGHVDLAGERWRAVSGSDHPLPAGTKVLITGVQGTTLIVWPADGHLPVDLEGGA